MPNTAQSDNSNTQLPVGRRFPSIDAVRKAFAQEQSELGFGYRVTKSDSNRSKDTTQCVVVRTHNNHSEACFERKSAAGSGSAVRPVTRELLSVHDKLRPADIRRHFKRNHGMVISYQLAWRQLHAVGKEDSLATEQEFWLLLPFLHAF
eukprot:jgi/Hompol1/6362/HPOL_004954-RA